MIKIIRITVNVMLTNNKTFAAIHNHAGVEFLHFQCDAITLSTKTKLHKIRVHTELTLCRP